EARGLLASLALRLALRPSRVLGCAFGAPAVVGRPALDLWRLGRGVVAVAGVVARGAFPPPQLFERAGDVGSGELVGDVAADDDRLPAFSVGGSQGPGLLEIVGVESDLAERASEDPLDRGEVLRGRLGEAERRERVGAVGAEHAGRQLLGGKRDLQRSAL